MTNTAHITSIDAVNDFRAALHEYEFDMRAAIAHVLTERQRGLDWVEHDRATYWPAEVRRASEIVLQARQDLERCEMAIRADERRSCYEQRMALERARQRLRLAEQKVREVRKWRVAVAQEGDRLHGRLLKLTDFLDTEFPRALAALARIIAALEKYTDRIDPARSDTAEGQR